MVSVDAGAFSAFVKGELDREALEDRGRHTSDGEGDDNDRDYQAGYSEAANDPEYPMVKYQDRNLRETNANFVQDLRKPVKLESSADDVLIE
ncbi:hypothetical protein PMZ80_011012 [Knufia obscura]|uniref:Uncharacterized protein n=1 Tax=Knufia obscura TaxID=1635080 RepID=A0ABR0R801_9EURO|nr:hypothetical protein PMZ80_011012 [Knufia obscura]